MRIAILLIASVLIGSLVAAQGPLKTDPPVIVQMSYYAQQGKEDEVLRLRLMAAEVLVKRGLTRGRVWRITGSKTVRTSGGRRTRLSGNPSADGNGHIRTERRYYRETR